MLILKCFIKKIGNAYWRITTKLYSRYLLTILGYKHSEVAIYICSVYFYLCVQQFQNCSVSINPKP